jgi:hypothetical protein
MNKLQQYIFKKHLTPGMKALYASTFSSNLRENDGSYSNDVQRAIRRKREYYHARFMTDRLADKLETHGNRGLWAKYQLRELAKLVFEDKSPASDALGDYLSIEIECIFKDHEALDSFVQWARKNQHSKRITIKQDGSLRPNEDCGCEDPDSCGCELTEVPREVVLTVKKSEYNIIESVCRELERLGCSVNKSCGLHVHFDMRHIKSARSVETFGKRVAACVPALRLMLPKSRANNRFCLEPINSFTDGNRYTFVNVQSFQKHRTLEIRGHSGTISAIKIINWIEILYAIMNKRGIHKCATIGEMCDTFKFKPSLVDYMYARYNKFKDTKEDISEPNANDEVSQDQETLTDSEFFARAMNNSEAYGTNPVERVMANMGRVSMEPVPLFTWPVDWAGSSTTVVVPRRSGITSGEALRQERELNASESEGE